MVKKIDKEKFKENIISFETKLLNLNDKHSISTIALPYPPIKKLNIGKDTILEVQIKIKNE